MPTNLALMEVFSAGDQAPHYIIVHSDGRLLSYAEAAAIAAYVMQANGQHQIEAPRVINT